MQIQAYARDYEVESDPLGTYFNFLHNCKPLVVKYDSDNIEYYY